MWEYKDVAFYSASRFINHQKFTLKYLAMIYGVFLQRTDATLARSSLGTHAFSGTPCRILFLFLIPSVSSLDFFPFLSCCCERSKRGDETPKLAREFHLTSHGKSNETLKDGRSTNQMNALKPLKMVVAQFCKNHLSSFRT